jgi:hypothetical protein
VFGHSGLEKEIEEEKSLLLKGLAVASKSVKEEVTELGKVTWSARGRYV